MNPADFKDLTALGLLAVVLWAFYRLASVLLGKALDLLSGVAGSITASAGELSGAMQALSSKLSTHDLEDVHRHSELSARLASIDRELAILRAHVKAVRVRLELDSSGSDDIVDAP